MPDISSNSRRIAKNTVFLYFRTLLLMFIGLFTSRVILKSLGVENYGIYNAIGGMVMMFTILTSSISQAISRYIACEIAKGDEDKLHRIFSTSVIIQIAACIVLLIITETLGVWFTESRLNIPQDRVVAARSVLQFSMLMLMIQLLNTPFNALIIAHEHMRSFSRISILEGVLKLLVAFALYLSSADKLILYAALMAGITLVIRFTYGSYCRRHFQESRGRLVFDRPLVSEMFGFAGWNFLGVSGFILNTQGVNTLANIFFGVIVSAARGIATQIETAARQLINCMMTAFIPQIMKSYATGDKQYCFELVGKSTKYCFLLMSMIFIPLSLDARSLLWLWLGQVPEYAVTFSVLGMAAVLADVVGQPLAHLSLATGNIRKYYLTVGPLSSLVFFVSWLLFRCGCAPHISYCVFIIVYALLIGVKLSILCPQTNLPLLPFLKEGVFRPLIASSVAAIPPAVIRLCFEASTARMIAIVAASLISLAVSAYFLALTEGERVFVRSKIFGRTR